MLSSNFLRRALKQHKFSLTRISKVSSTEMPALSKFGQSFTSHEELHEFSVDKSEGLFGASLAATISLIGGPTSSLIPSL